MKRLFLLFCILMPLVSFGQSEDAKQLTKFEQFTSKTGTIIKFVDVNLPRLSLSYGSLSTGIRTIKGATNAYFYRIEKEETDRSVAKIAMIDYSDLVEINKALDKLTSEVNDDIATNPDYMENKFKTDDGFEVGYYISKGKANWFLKLERYSNSTVFPSSQEVVITAFKGAQYKIEELKAQYSQK